MLPEIFSKHPQFQKIHDQFFTNLAFWLAAAVSALVSVFYTKIFAFCEAWSISQGGHYIFWAPTVGLLASFLMGHLFSKEALGSGIPQVIAAVTLSEKSSNPGLLDKLMSLRMLFVKIIGSCVAVLGGGVSGREGPTLQVSASIFYSFHKLWPKSLPKPGQGAMILGGGSAGLAAAFNTPMGGIVFAIEELSKSHVSLVRTSIFQAVIISGLMAQFFLGNYVYFGQNHVLIQSNIFFQTILISALVGMVSSLFSESLYRLSVFRGNLTFAKKILMTIFCGMALSTIFYFFGSVAMGSGKHVIVDILNDPQSIETPVTAFARIFGNFFTYNAGVAGGIFAPSLASGASLGQYLGFLMGFGEFRVFALVGMVAFLTGVTRSPFTASVLVLEMSDSHEIILYLMLGSMVANLCAKLVARRSFYEKAAERIEKMGENFETKPA